MTTNKISILKPLPDPFYTGMEGVTNNQNKGGGEGRGVEAAKKFFESRLAGCDRREVGDEFKRTLVLEAQRSKQLSAAKAKKKPRVSKKMLTAREKRDLGLHRLPKKGLNYQQFKDLHELWKGYMQELLELDKLKQDGWKPGNLLEPKLQQLQMKICRADFHGAIIKVEKADCSSHVGNIGICLMETKHTIQLISLDNKLRIFPKKGTTFSLEVDGFKFSFPGSAMLTKPPDRATKRPKLKMPLDF